MLDGNHDDGRKPDIYRRVEVITGPVRRRRWTLEEKSRIVAESFAGRLSALAVARRHGVSGGVLYCSLSAYSYQGSAARSG